MELENRSIELSCPGDLRLLPHIRAFVRNVAFDLGFCEEDVEKIEISVDEACANAILHAYSSDEQDRRITINLKPVTGGLEIYVADLGCGSLNGQPHSGTRDLEEYLSKESPSGLGVYIMGRMMDDVKFSYPPKRGTVVSMIKRLGS